ncbi:MAG: Fic family protein, partial [Pseudanabaena sp.]
TGRIINILYLVKQGLLGSPVLYLSRYINQYKTDYYRLLQEVRTEGNWEDWLLFMLEGIEQTSRQTIVLIQSIRDLMQQYKIRLRGELPKIYSQDLLNIIFSHPYSKIEFVVQGLEVTRITATRYFDEMTRIGLMSKQKLGRDNYYINIALFNLLSNVHEK